VPLHERFPLLPARRAARPSVAALVALLTAGVAAAASAGPAAAQGPLAPTVKTGQPGRSTAVSARQHGPHRKVAVLAGHLQQSSSTPQLSAPLLVAPRVTSPPTATFQVTYTNFPPAAQAAFQAAVDAWSHIVVSTVPITVKAVWMSEAPGVLGQASPDFSLRNGVYLPTPLAEAESGTDSNAGRPDIDAEFSSNANWSYAATGTVPWGQYDLQSVVTHELGHGLGFIGSLDDDTAGVGSWGGGTSSPVGIDNFVIDGAGRQVDHTYANHTTALGSVLSGSSGALRFSGAHAKAANSNVAPLLYTPTPFSPASSIDHLDEATYPAGTANALMTPILNDGEVVRDPGPIVRGMMQDIGWPTAATTQAPLSPAVATPIATRYAAMGGSSSVLGAPVGGEYAVPGGTAQNYVSGRMYYSAATGAHEVHVLILSRYLALGGPAGALRLPITDETRTPDGVGRYNHFSAGGSIYWTPTTSAHAVYGAIRVRWSQLGWERGALGYPTTDEYSVTGGRRSDFQHGSITWTAASGAITVTYR